jgi:hypothetical protein
VLVLAGLMGGGMAGVKVALNIICDSLPSKCDNLPLNENVTVYPLNATVYL